MFWTRVSATLRFFWLRWTVWILGVGSSIWKVLEENDHISHYHAVPRAGRVNIYVIIIHSFTRLLNKDVLNNYPVPGPVLGPDDTDILWLNSWLWRWHQVNRLSQNSMKSSVRRVSTWCFGRPHRKSGKTSLKRWHLGCVLRDEQELAWQRNGGGIPNWETHRCKGMKAGKDLGLSGNCLYSA